MEGRAGLNGREEQVRRRERRREGEGIGSIGDIGPGVAILSIVPGADLRPAPVIDELATLGGGLLVRGASYGQLRHGDLEGVVPPVVHAAEQGSGAQGIAHDAGEQTPISG